MVKSKIHADGIFPVPEHLHVPNLVGLATLVGFPLQQYTMLKMAAHRGTRTADERPIRGLSSGPLQGMESSDEMLLYG